MSESPCKAPNSEYEYGGAHACVAQQHGVLGRTQRQVGCEQAKDDLQTD